MKLRFRLDPQYQMAEVEARLRAAMTWWKYTQPVPGGPLCGAWTAGDRGGAQQPGCTHDSCRRIATGGLV